MRTCKFKIKYKFHHHHLNGERIKESVSGKCPKWVHGCFHGWFPSYEEFETNAGNFVEAYVEDRKGRIHAISYIKDIVFTDKPTTGEPYANRRSNQGA